LDEQVSRSPDTGTVIWVEESLPDVDAQLWVVRGELGNVRRLIQRANSDIIVDEQRLEIIGQFNQRNSEEANNEIPSIFDDGEVSVEVSEVEPEEEKEEKGSKPVSQTASFPCDFFSIRSSNLIDFSMVIFWKFFEFVIFTFIFILIFLIYICRFIVERRSS
jgi:hypothetical protein